MYQNNIKARSNMRRYKKKCDKHSTDAMTYKLSYMIRDKTAILDTTTGRLSLNHSYMILDKTAILDTTPDPFSLNRSYMARDTLYR